MAKKAKDDGQETSGTITEAEPKKQVNSVEYPEAVDSEGSATGDKYDIILDMDVPIMVALGHTEIPVRRLLQLGPGSVLTLDKPVDSPAELYLKDSKFAVGEVVVVDGQFAVRIREIMGVKETAQA